jgi:hypothetical protein
MTLAKLWNFILSKAFGKNLCIVYTDANSRALWRRRALQTRTKQKRFTRNN